MRVSKLNDRMFQILGFAATLAGLGALAWLLYTVFSDGASRLSWQFVSSFPSRKPEEAGILSAWVGTVWLMVVTGLIAFPLGVAAAIYLEEYGKKNRLAALIEMNISNLAAVPSIIYGLLGLGIFVRWMHLGKSVLAGALTLAILVLPVIVMATRESLRSIPPSIREASLALGASKWQTIYHQILPAAMPGVLTGTILAMSRAIGETAPLIMIGALTYIAFLPAAPVSADFPFLSAKGLLDPFTALPIQIYNWVSRPQKGFATDAAAGILVLLAIVFLMNGAAIVLRNHYRRKIRW